MSTYSVAVAKNNLSELVHRALKGEGVVITRHGAPVAEMRAVRPAPGPVTDADLAWLDSRRVSPLKPLAEDAGALISRMRDEDAH
jgi:antitoxin (DNA-binding transcriptional repressor) of toxin-antitoxin stability system